jgi:hypothetical protein
MSASGVGPQADAMNDEMIAGVGGFIVCLGANFTRCHVGRYTVLVVCHALRRRRDVVHTKTEAIQAPGERGMMPLCSRIRYVSDQHGHVG